MGTGFLPLVVPRDTQHSEDESCFHVAPFTEGKGGTFLAHHPY